MSYNDGWAHSYSDGGFADHKHCAAPAAASQRSYYLAADLNALCAPKAFPHWYFGMPALAQQSSAVFFEPSSLFHAAPSGNSSAAGPLLCTANLFEVGSR